MASIDFNITEKYEGGNALVSWQRVRFPKVAGDIACYFSAKARKMKVLRMVKPAAPR